MKEGNEEYSEPDIIKEEEEPEYMDVPSPDAKKIFTDKLDISIKELCDKIRKKTLNPRPEYQRYDVFDPGKKSRLIESALLNIPIPVLYFQEEDDSSLSVIDGQQRLNSFYEFLFLGKELTGLEILSRLNGKKYADIGDTLQNKLDNSSLRCIVLRKESDESLKFDIFSRLNTGAVHLNAMEIRNCLYGFKFGGKFSNMLKKLANLKTWKLASGYKFPHKRMLDVELILRFISLHDWYGKYDGQMKRLLNSYMDPETNPSVNKDDEMKRIEMLFKKTIDKVFSVFGEHSFRSFRPGTPDNPDGYWDKSLSKSLFDVEMLVLAEYPKNQVIKNADEIRASLVDLIIEDDKFKDLYLVHTTDKVNLMGRIERWKNKLESTIGPPLKDKRVFTKSDRQMLFKKDNTCQICGQKIMTIEDAHIDHKKPYSMGGETTLENAQLTHRFCNLSKKTNSA